MDSFINFISSFMSSTNDTKDTSIEEKKDESLIFYDFETTGLNPFSSKIIEYAFMKSEDDYISSLVNPETKFEFKITQITGIYPQELEDKPTIKDKKDEILNYIYSDDTQTYLVAHNNDGFDKWFFKKIVQQQDAIDFKEFKFIDTLILAKMLYPKIKSFSMKSLCQKFNIDLSAHRAYNDTDALRKVYEYMCNDLSTVLHMSKQDILDNPGIVYTYIYE